MFGGNGGLCLPEEIERGRNNREIDKLYGAESLLGRTEMLQSYRMHLGRFDGLEEDLRRIRVVTPESVHAEASRLVPDRRRVGQVSGRSAVGGR